MPSLAALLPPLSEAVGAAIRGPFAIFGHSMGALLGFELARRLRDERGVQPMVLAVSGCRAPQLGCDRKPMHELPNADFLERLRELNGTPQEVLQHPELMDALLPVMRADFAVLETYVHVPGPPLACPIVAFGGTDDPTVRVDHLEAWASQTRGSFRLEMFPGDHFFVHANRRAFLAALSRCLRAA